jgi:hypothetical protein
MHVVGQRNVHHLPFWISSQAVVASVIVNRVVPNAVLISDVLRLAAISDD